MAATLKVDDATKQALDRLQATLTLQLGRRPALQEVVEQLARLGWRHQDDVVAALRGETQPMGPDEARRIVRMLARPHPPGTEQPGRDDLDLHGEGA